MGSCEITKVMYSQDNKTDLEEYIKIKFNKLLTQATVYISVKEIKKVLKDK